MLTLPFALCCLLAGLNHAECVHAEHMLQAAQRAIKNKALSYLSALKDAKVTADLLQRTRSATNMTDQISALACLVDSEGEHLLVCNQATCSCSAHQSYACSPALERAVLLSCTSYMSWVDTCRSREGDSIGRVLRAVEG